ncbi:hypothetical protein OS493_000556 [Desmophyllum pertusum]|uniref:Fibrinogen C-terminal domain-containing protein n=1 Tax=Desmophyllum pertusum TaxID=174260 RepID=A0A9X0A842_9CNID|nr:hypothetical protein OS493_000556 [Desmophyllum pertusum]
MAAVGTIRVSMEEPAKKSVSPRAFGTNCSCPVPFFGKRCEIHPRRSCQDYKAAGIKTSGLYTIEDDNSRTIEVYCDFHSEPGFAWNLVESFSLSKKDLFQSDVVFYDYSDSSAVSGDAPNWEAYLMKRHFLVWLRDHSTHWRATCRYNTDGTSIVTQSFYGEPEQRLGSYLPVATEKNGFDLWLCSDV